MDSFSIPVHLAQEQKRADSRGSCSGRSVGHPLAVVTLENGLRLLLRRNGRNVSAQVEVKDELLSNDYYETLFDSEVSESPGDTPLSRINPRGVFVTHFTVSNARSVYLCIRVHFQIPFQHFAERNTG
jgi:hypothetical protein